MRWIVKLLIVSVGICLFGASSSQAQHVTIPSDIAEKMLELGILEEHIIDGENGNSYKSGRPLLCNGCGNYYLTDPLEDHVSCQSCSYPMTENTKKFVTPSWVDDRNRLHVLLPKDNVVNGQNNSVSARAITARLAKWSEIDLVDCPHCQRLNNPSIFKSCYSCGAPIPQDKVKPATIEKSTTPVLEESFKAIPPQETRPTTVVKNPPRTLRGGVQTKTPTPSTTVADNKAPKRVSPPKPILPRRPILPKGALMGAAGVMVVSAATLGIAYGMTGDDIHIFRGEVEVINREHVRIHVPGRMEPISLTYDSSSEYNRPEYSKTTLLPYLDADFVEIWWTRKDGVIQIIPLTFDDELGLTEVISG